MNHSVGIRIMAAKEKFTMSLSDFNHNGYEMERMENCIHYSG